MRNERIEGHESGAYVALVRSQAMERGMALPARAEGSRSRGSTRRSHARPRSAGKRRTGGSAAGSTRGKRRLARNALGDRLQRLLETGEPGASKDARRVRRGEVG